MTRDLSSHRRPGAAARLVLAAASAGALAACGSGGTASTPSAGPSVGPSAAPGTSGARASSHVVAPCADARPLPGSDRGPTDVVLGALRYGGLRAAAHLAPDVAPPTSGGSTFYKSGARVRPGATVTVTVVAPSWATLITESGPTNGTRSVTYVNCKRTAQWWVGGVALWGHRTGCVTLEATPDGDARPRRTVVSLNAGRC